MLYRFIYNIPYGWAGYAHYTYVYRFKLMGYIKRWLLNRKHPGTTIWNIEILEKL